MRVSAALWRPSTLAGPKTRKRVWGWNGARCDGTVSYMGCGRLVSWRRQVSRSEDRRYRGNSMKFLPERTTVLTTLLAMNLAGKFTGMFAGQVLAEVVGAVAG